MSVCIPCTSWNEAFGLERDWDGDRGNLNKLYTKQSPGASLYKDVGWEPGKSGSVPAKGIAELSKTLTFYITGQKHPWQ